MTFSEVEITTFYAVCGLFFLSFLVYILYTVFGKNKYIAGTATGLFITGFIFLTLNLSVRTYSAGRAPFSNLYESLISFTWGLVIIYLVVERLYKLNILGLFASAVAVITMLYAATLPKEIEPLIPALQSYWLTFHVLCFVFAYGAFALSCGGGVLYLILSFVRKKKDIKEEGPLSLYTIELLIYRIIAFAFPFMTLGIITGAIWADKAWGSYWSWDPKETWSLITWLVYAAFLHARYNNKWKGTVTAIMSIIGFLVVMFTYLGVNFFLKGLHSYAK